ncbi:ankyrin repeat-containing domain protein [Mycena crocata]|nr:ankyrin repeat-containing domain protein [Mycena crocata]
MVLQDRLKGLLKLPQKRSPPRSSTPIDTGPVPRLSSARDVPLLVGQTSDSASTTTNHVPVASATRGPQPAPTALVSTPVQSEAPHHTHNEPPVKATDLGIDNIALVFDLAEKLAGFFQTGVPFIAPVAGCLSQIAKAYKEVRATSEKRDVLLARVTLTTQHLYTTILRMQETNHSGLIGRLKPDVDTYAELSPPPMDLRAKLINLRTTRLLGKALVLLKEYDDRGTVIRIAARTQLAGAFVNIQQELDAFGAIFRTNRLVDLAINQNEVTEIMNEIYEMAVVNKLEKWMGPPPDMKQKQHMTQQLHREGTCRWFLEGDGFIKWQDYPGVLWIQGHSGSGKTVLSSVVINKLIDDQRLARDLGKSSAVAFFYFDFKDKNGNAVENAFRRVVLQLSAQSTCSYTTLHEHFMLSNGQTLPTYQDLVKVFQRLLLELGRTYLVLDALDECQETELNKLMDFVLMLCNWDRSRLHVMITSQPRQFFTDNLSSIPRIYLDAENTRQDIRRYVTAELQHNHKMGKWASRAGDIVDRVVSRSNGMFRLAACFLVEISRCKWEDELDETLRNLPSDLFSIYDRFLLPIRKKDLIYVMGALRWLVFSAQQLTLTQLADTIAFDFSSHDQYIYYPRRRGRNADALREWLEGPVLIEENIVKLAHVSVQDYITSKEFKDQFGYDLRAGLSHTWIAQTCISYLLHFSGNPLDSSTALTYPLAINWGRPLLPPLHLCWEEQYMTGMGGLLSMGSHIDIQHAGMTVLQAACIGEDQEMMHFLLENGADINASGGNCGYMLNFASWRGCTRIVGLLLKAGAGVDINTEYMDFWGRRLSGTALQLACVEGHADIVGLLLEKGADVNASGGTCGLILHITASRGHVDIVELLLAAGSKISNIKGQYMNPHGRKLGGTALQAACMEGHVDVMRLLLENGADPDVSGGDCGHMLHFASCQGRTDIAGLLLEAGVLIDVNTEHTHMGGRKFRGTALQAACMEGRVDVIRLLLENGADPDVSGGDCDHMLHFASCQGRTDIAGLLLEAGVLIDINIEHTHMGGRKFRGTALQMACMEGHTDVMRLLLDKGADNTVDGGDCGNMLHFAAGRGRIDIVELLLEAGAWVHLDAKYTNFWGRELIGTALQVACMEGHADVMCLLIEKGADATASGGDCGHMLHFASCRGRTDIVALLLAAGSDINAEGECLNVRGRKLCGTAFQVACMEGHGNIIRLLLENGAEDATGGDWGSMLQLVSNRGYTDVARILLAAGSDINAEDEYIDLHGRKLSGTALQAACLEGHMNTMHFLLKRGADVSASGGDCGHILPFASCRGHTDIVALLLSTGSDVNAEGQYMDPCGRKLNGSALQAACMEGHGKVMCLLLEKGADATASGGHCGSMLHLASNRGYINIAQILLTTGLDINTDGECLGAGGRRPRGTALQLACATGRTNIVRLLLERGAKTYAGGPDYGFMLHFACYKGYIGIARMLLETGVGINTEGECLDPHGRRFHGTALHFACMMGHTDIVRLLLKKGARHGVIGRAEQDGGHCIQMPFDEEDSEDNQTPLQIAVTEGHTQTVSLLLASGAEIVDEMLCTASYSGFIEIVSLLLAKGADVNASGKYCHRKLHRQDYHGSALQAASHRGHENIVRFLLHNGADIESHGESAMEVAFSNGYGAIVAILLAKGVPRPAAYGMRTNWLHFPGFTV